MKNSKSKYQSLYQVNTRTWLRSLSAGKTVKATLDDIPDTELDRMAGKGFDWIWLLSVWTTGGLARSISRNNPEWLRDFRETLPDLCEEDIAGSGFAIAAYEVSPVLGGNAALHRLQARLHQRGMKLMLDFVPNHMGPDHPWLESHPEYFIRGTEAELEKYPQHYFRIRRKDGDMIFAHGRDPYFPGWPDTVQLDYSNPGTVNAMRQELIRISGLCDGLRCDMAMLILPDVFEKTWGKKAQPFWPDAIAASREMNPDFCFLAEVYWDMEWDLQQLGFDYTYDKRLYDRLRDGQGRAVREHFYAAPDYQDKLVRFLENHDEARSASVFELKRHKAAAILTYLSPGMRFFHQGQLDGYVKRISPHLVRAPEEVCDPILSAFYDTLTAVINKKLLRDGKWRLLECRPAWHGNATWDSFIAFAWEAEGGDRLLITVNYAAQAGQCYVSAPFTGMINHSIKLKDLTGPASYSRDADELREKGLYLDMSAWGYHVFEVS
jgi:glycosidase